MAPQQRQHSRSMRVTGSVTEHFLRPGWPLGPCTTPRCSDGGLCCGGEILSDPITEKRNNIFAEELVGSIHASAHDPFSTFPFTQDTGSPPMCWAASQVSSRMSASSTNSQADTPLRPQHEVFEAVPPGPPPDVNPWTPRMQQQSGSLSPRQHTVLVATVAEGTNALASGCSAAGKRSNTLYNINPLTGFITVSVPACDYQPDPTDRIDIELVRVLRYVGVEAAAVVMMRRLLPGRYEIDHRRVTLSWADLDGGLVAHEEDISDPNATPVTLPAYLQQVANVALQLSGRSQQSPRALTFSNVNVPVVSTSMIHDSGCDREKMMRLACEQAAMREKTSQRMYKCESHMSTNADLYMGNSSGKPSLPDQPIHSQLMHTCESYTSTNADRYTSSSSCTSRFSDPPMRSLKCTALKI